MSRVSRWTADLRLALRAALRERGFALSVMLCMALGICTFTAVLSVVDTVLFRVLPYAGAERLVVVRDQFLHKDLTRVPLSESELADLRQQSTTLERISGMLEMRFDLTGAGQPEQLVAALVSADYFPLLGVQAALGRTFLPAEEVAGHDRVVVLSDGLWRRLFAGDPRVTERSLSLNGEPYRIVGVLPPSFRSLVREHDIWAPLGHDAAHPMPRNARAVLTLGRLRSGRSLAAAQSEMEAIAAGFQRTFPDLYKADSGWGIRLFPLREELAAELRPALLTLLAAAALVLLIAAGNAVHLLLARAAGRGQEVALRSALGASRGDLVRPFVAQSLSLTVAGGAAGSLAAFCLVRLLAANEPGSLPHLYQISLDGRLLAFTLALAVLLGIALGLAPAATAVGRSSHQLLREGARPTTGGRHGVRSLLVISEVALALVVLIGAVLLVRTYREVRRVPLGFDPHNVLTLQVFLPYRSYREVSAASAFFERLLPEIERLPGVQSAAVISDLPLGGSDLGGEITAERQDPSSRERNPTVSWRVISPGYFATLRIPLLRGRIFRDADNGAAPGVVILDRQLAEHLWPGDPAIGRRLKLRDWANTDWLTVVGVVGAVVHDGLAEPLNEQLYLPEAQSGRRLMSVVVRTDRDPALLAPTIQRRIWNLAPDEPLQNVLPMERLVDASTSPLLLDLWLLGGAAAVAVLLAALGLFSTLSYAVALRRREIGIRMALGAPRASVLRMMLREALGRTLLGLVLGVILAAWATRYLASLLFHVAPTDLMTFLVASLLLLALGLAAALLPARRAAAVDPLVAMRIE